MLAAEGDEQAMATLYNQKEIANILGRLAMDEGTKVRWEQLQNVLGRLFDVSKPLTCWFDQNAFITSYTYTKIKCLYLTGIVQYMSFVRQSVVALAIRAWKAAPSSSNTASSSTT